MRNDEAFEQKCVASDIQLFLRLARLKLREDGRASKSNEALFDWLVEQARRYGNGEEIVRISDA